MTNNARPDLKVAMNRLSARVMILAATALLSACGAPNQMPEATGTFSIDVAHDEARGVTCFARRGYGEALQCFPDWMLVKPGTEEKR